VRLAAGVNLDRAADDATAARPPAGRGTVPDGLGRHRGDGPPPGSGDGAARPDGGVLHRSDRVRLLADELGPRVPVVDGYAVGEELGSGGSGQVWAGTGPDGQRRALKVLHPDVAGTGDLLRELALLRRVRHPRVVAVHDISRDAGGRPVLVLDLAAGGSLAGLLRSRRRLGAAEVVGLLSALGPALEELHAAGVVHGDLSPGNVLLDARGEPLLADLGLARALGRRPGSVLGTPGFADPAALSGEDPGAAGDVYGLAAVCWCALTGAPPPAGRRRPGRRAGGQLPPGTSQELLAVLRSGLHPRPSRRPTPGELAEAALTCARPRPLRLPPPTLPGVAAGRAGGGGVASPVGAPSPGAPAPSPAGAHRAASPLPGPRPAERPDIDVHAVTRELRAAAAASGTAGPPPPRDGVVSRAGTARPAAAPAGPARPRGSRPPRAGAAPRPGRLLLVGVPVLLLGLAGGAVLRHEHGAAQPVATGTAGPVAGRDVEAAPEASPAAAAPGSPGPGRPTAAPSAAGPPGAGAPSAGASTATGVPSADAAAQDVGADVLAGDDVPAAVRELAARRAAALAGGDPSGLLAVDAGGSTALAADTALLAQLRTAGLRWSGLSFDVGDVRVAETSAQRAVVLADVVTGAHEVVAGDGSSTAVAAATPRTSRLTLQRVAGQWRVEAVG